MTCEEQDAPDVEQPSAHAQLTIRTSDSSMLLRRYHGTSAGSDKHSWELKMTTHVCTRTDVPLSPRPLSQP